MRFRAPLAVVLTVGMALAGAGVATAHGGGEDGHVPANTNYGISPVGYSPLQGVQDGRYTDVWAHEGHAYVGSFQNPDCSNDGVYIADIRDPQQPKYLGQIHSAPGTRVNDVKVTDVGDRDILIFSHEVCGTDVALSSASQMGRDRSEVITDDGVVGQGSDGISLYDVTTPNAPRKLVKGFLETEVHNTFPWTNEEGRTFLLVVDDFNTNDTWIVEITNPDEPELLVKTGLADWLGIDGSEPELAFNSAELFLGTFAFPLLHDVWVEYNDVEERWEAVLSYWDAGFVKLDVSDPANPVFLADSDYLAQDPILADFRTAFNGRPEGNAHAAVFGGDDNEFIFAGDEDFDATALTITQGELSMAANDGSDTPPVPEAGLTGPLTYVGLACDSSDPVPAAEGGDQIALVERGACAFTEKAGNVSAADYAAGILFNSAPNGCDGSISMLVEGDIPFVSITRAEGFALMDLDCAGGGVVPSIGSEFDPVTVTSSFVGWGYFWALNNQTTSRTVPGTPGGMGGPTVAGPMDTIGYYAPAEVADPDLASGAGDLTMHNLETDIKDPERVFISWYSLGMRAVEWRAGHFHDDSNNEGSYSWNIHEVGRWIAGDVDDPAAHLELVEFAAQHKGVEPEDLAGSNFWGVTQAEIDGERYILGSDRNTGLWIFEYECQDPDGGGPLYCGDVNESP